MPIPVRILVLDRNRYRSLMIERTVTQIAPDAMVARFSSGTDVVRELISTHYDVAILSLDGIERPVDMMQAIQMSRPDVKLLVVGLPETPKRVISAIEPTVESYLSWETDSGTLIPNSIYRVIEKACGIGSGLNGEAVAAEESALIS